MSISILSNMKSLLEQLEESDGFLIARIGSESHHRFMEVMNGLGLSMYQQAVLATLLGLAEEGATSQKQLGEMIGIDPRNLVPVVDSLEARHFVQRIPTPADRRRYSIRLTKEGERLARQVQVAGRELEEEMFSPLTRQEKTTLHKLLLKLYQTVENVKR